MLIISIARGSLIVVFGVILYRCLLYTVDRRDRLKLRRTKPYSGGYCNISKNKIMLIYVLVLIVGTLLLFLSIRNS